MSHPSWLPPKSTNEPVGHVTARMETTHAFGTPSISVSTQQTPKKFAPVVAPKPKYNPYKQPGGDGEYFFFFRRDPQKSYSGKLTSNTNCLTNSWFMSLWEPPSPSPIFETIPINKNVKEPCTLWQAILLNGTKLGESRGTAVPLFLLESSVLSLKLILFQEFCLFHVCQCMSIQEAGAWTPFLMLFFFGTSTMGLLYKHGIELGVWVGMRGFGRMGLNMFPLLPVGLIHVYYFSSAVSGSWIWDELVA